LGPALTLAARAAQADGVVDKAGPAPALLAAVRSVANGEVVMSPVPCDVFEAAVARLDDVDPLRIAESHSPWHWQGTPHSRS
jgi:DNA-binding NarL/FixJ family response regulator